MIRAFEAATADHIWQKLTCAFRESDGVCVQASRDGPTKEILHVAISIEEPRQRWIASREPPLNVAFALAEVVWIVAGRRDLKFLEFWNSRLRNFVGPGPVLHGAYGHRLRRRFGLDQLKRAYDALRQIPETRQIALQIWDSSIDLPQASGSPVAQDIPCNVVSLPKIRDGKLEWTQVIRSNDLFLGVPYNLVQFTCLQEIMAGWLGVECGSYNQISDSLHIYERDVKKVLTSRVLPHVASNPDSLALPWGDSELVFKELENRIERMIGQRLTEGEFVRLSRWHAAPQAYRNILAVLAAEALRRQGQVEATVEVMSACTNPLYRQLWNRWLSKMNGIEACASRHESEC